MVWPDGCDTTPFVRSTAGRSRSAEIPDHPRGIGTALYAAIRLLAERGDSGHLSRQSSLAAPALEPL